MKIAIIGGGSTYTPVLIKSLLGTKNCAGVSEICLMDINESDLEMITQFCRVLSGNEEKDLQIKSTTDLAEAMKNTSLIITMYRAGGLDARQKDIMLALNNGIIGQETQGLGGFLSALRNISVLDQIVKCLRSKSPDAWLLNLTNPVGIITKASTLLGVKSVGICELPYKMQGVIAKCCSTNRSNIQLDYVGLNHFGWVRNIKVGGEDVTSNFFLKHLERAIIESKPLNIPSVSHNIDFVKALGAFPCPYLSYYYNRFEMFNVIKNSKTNRAEICMEINEKLKAEYKALRLDSWESQVRNRGGYLLGETVALFIAQLNGMCLETQMIVNLPNNDSIQELPKDIIVEIPCNIQKNSITPEPAKSPLNSHIRGMMSICSSYESMTAEAGINGDYDLALMALTTHPLIQDTSLAKKLLDITLSNEDFPQFK